LGYFFSDLAFFFKGKSSCLNFFFHRDLGFSSVLTPISELEGLRFITLGFSCFENLVKIGVEKVFWLKSVKSNLESGMLVASFSLKDNFED